MNTIAESNIPPTSLSSKKIAFLQRIAREVRKACAHIKSRWEPIETEEIAIDALVKVALVDDLERLEDSSIPDETKTNPTMGKTRILVEKALGYIRSKKKRQ